MTTVETQIFQLILQIRARRALIKLVKSFNIRGAARLASTQAFFEIDAIQKQIEELRASIGVPRNALKTSSTEE